MRFRHFIWAGALGAAVPLAATAGAETVAPLAGFRQIELRGGGTVIIRHGPVQRVTFRKGSAAYTDVRVRAPDEPFSRGARADRLVINACNDRCPRRYDLEIEIVTPDVSAVAVKGGGKIVVEPGFPRERSVAAAVSGGGEIDLRALPAQTVAAAVHGGGRLLVRPQNTLAAAVTGGGEIRYWGTPAVSTSIQGGGTVTRGH
jgi:hypothetical protein